jgi:hypothetical protein
MPLFKNSQLERDAIFWHYPHYSPQGGTPAATILAGEWKLIEFFEDNRLELYHLRTDPSETRNLFETERERAQALHKKLKAWQTSIEAKFPSPNAEYLQKLKRPLIPNNAHV